MKKKPPSKETINPSVVFCVGTNVEVLTEQGAWYPAHVICDVTNSSPSPPFSLRSRKQQQQQQRRLLVEYETLVYDEDPSKPLREEIDVAQLRPAPPAENEEGFEARDVVEAFHVDGWWRGVVMSVDADDMYTVGFKSPPDLLVVRRVDLRRHWDWSGGAWTKTGKETMMMQLDFSPGDYVEVNLSKEHPWYSWTPATYVGPLGGNSFLVCYLSVINSDEKAVVSHHQIRPRPPQQDEREIELMSMVDAYHNKSWWIGDVTKVLSGEKYTVTFRFSKEEMTFRRSDLRHHMEWNSSGTWLTDPKALQESIVSVEQLRYKNTRYRNAKEKTPSHTKTRKKQSAVCVNDLHSGNIFKKVKLSQPCKTGATFSSPTSSKKLTEEDSEDSLPLATVFGRALPINISQGKDGKKPTTFLLQNSEQQLDGDATGPPINNGRSPGGRKARRKKLQAKKRSRINNEQILEDDHVIEGMESSSIGVENKFIWETVSETLCLLPTEDNQHNTDGLGSGMRELPMIAAEHLIDPTTGSEYSVRDGLAATLVKVPLAVSGMPEKITDHDQSSLMLINEGDSVNIMEQSITGVEGDTDREELSLPFVKSIPLWESIESLEVFKRFPQKPHFRPLLKTKVVLREGSAFGKMVAFASLVDQTTKFCVSDPRDAIESNLEATVELEMYGFDVSAIKHRLTKLLEFKLRLEELHNQSKAVETKIAECRPYTVKGPETISEIDKEIKDLEENIKALKEKRAMVASKCSEGNKLHSEALGISEYIKDIQHGFELLVAFPL